MKEKGREGNEREGKGREEGREEGREGEGEGEGEGNDQLFLSLVLQMLRAAETLELSVHHDGNTTTQSFTLLHAVSETRREKTKYM